MGDRLLNGCLLAVATAMALVVLLAPYLNQGYPPGDSGDFNLALAANFLKQLYWGQLYPRWLVDFGIVGAPVFYFYGPAPFYLAAVPGAVCPGCDVQTVLSVTHGLLYLLSAASFFLWARSLAPPALSLLGALWYAVLPYHFIDMEYRNAIGESMGYLFMPLLLLGVTNLAGGARWLCLAAVAYAALIVTHLPTALLITPVMAVFSLARADRATWRPRLSQLVAAGLLGAGLAGIYLVPALLLRDTLVPDAWVSGSGQGYHPERWLFLSRHEPPFGDWGFQANVARAIGFASILAFLSVAALWLVRALSQHREDPLFGPRRARTVAAAVASIALAWAMMTPVSAWLWINVEVLRQVQFPWRFGTIVDVCAATVVTVSLARLSAFMPPAWRVPRGAWTNGLLALMVVVTALGLSFADTPRTLIDNPRSERDRATVAAITTPVILPALSGTVAGWGLPVEYRGKWVVNSEIYGGPITGDSVLERHEAAYARWREHVSGLPPVSAAGDTGPLPDYAFARAGPTAFDIAVSFDQPRTLLIRVAYFPAWTLTDRGSGRELRISPDPETGLIRASLPAGAHAFRLAIRPLPEERIGAAASAASLAFILGLLLRGRARGVTGRARRSPL